MGLEGKVALVTGAGGQGMGRSIALSLARDGADLVLNHHLKREHIPRTVEAIEAMGRRVLAHAADISDPGAVGEMVRVAKATFGKVDILVNNAGGPWTPRDITQIEPEHLREVISEEIESVFYLLREVLPGMRERGWGRIVTIGGHMADDWRFGPPDAPLDYPLGKAARHWLTRTLAPFERERGITVNAVAPGPTQRISHDEAVAAVWHKTGPHEGITPQDIAEIVAFLCSEQASHITGAVIPVPGARPF